MSSRRKLTVALLGVGACAVASVAMMWRLGRGAPLPRGEGFNVLLISMDTTRADHLHCYGDQRIKTPNIDRLAAEGVLFEQCTTAAPITLPSHCSMMTGTYPYVHGVRDNGQFYLHEDNETLAESLHAAGYATAAEVAAYVLNREFGMDQGFDVYNDTHLALNNKDRGASRVAGLFTERKAEEICTSAIQWLRGNASKRCFMFVHFYDPHQPFEAPARFASRYAHPYRAEIAYVDEQIGRLLAELERLGLADKTLVVLSADHGEGLGQHGEETHAPFVYDTTLSVPLILRCPGRIAAGKRVAAQVRTIDIPATIVAFLGLPPMEDAQGVSLLPLAAGREGDLDLIAYGESLYPLYNYGYAPLRAVRTQGWKYIHAPRSELYRVSVDPGELRNLASENPERVEAMRAWLTNLIAESPAMVETEKARREWSPRAVEALQSLGYVAGGEIDALADKSELDLLEPSGPDPKDYAEVIRLTSRAMSLVRNGDYAAAEQWLRALIEESPDQQAGFSWAHANLGGVLAAQEEFEQAIVHYRKALEARPDDGRTLTNLGIALVMTGKVEEAIAMYEQALRQPPTFARTHHNFGIALALSGKPEQAIQQYKLALEKDAELPEAHANLARIYVRVGRLDEAIGAFQRAVELMPDNPRLLRELAEFSAEQGRPGEALKHYQALLRLEPGDATAHAGLAQAFRSLNRPDEAIESLGRALELAPQQVAWWDTLGFLLLVQERYKEAIEVLRAGLNVAPNHASMANNLAWLLATSPDAALRNGEEAVQLAECAADVTGAPNCNELDTLAAAYAAAGRFEEAIRAAKRAIALATDSERAELASRISARLELYQQGKPYRSE